MWNEMWSFHKGTDVKYVGRILKRIQVWKFEHLAAKYMQSKIHSVA